MAKSIEKNKQNYPKHPPGPKRKWKDIKNRIQSTVNFCTLVLPRGYRAGLSFTTLHKRAAHELVDSTVKNNDFMETNSKSIRGL